VSNLTGDYDKRNTCQHRRLNGMTANPNALATDTVELYATDFVTWAEQQAALLEQKQFGQLDLANLIDEVLDLSKRERQALYSNFKIILLHLLKWNYQPAMRSNSWKASTREHRQRVARQLKDSPSLKPYLQEIFTDCYQDARFLAVDETELPEDTFPSDCPFSVSDTLNPDFLGG
jgi:hypothetical protein